MDGRTIVWAASMGRHPLLLFMILFLLIANGRMDSGDSNAELQGAFNLVRSGSFGTDQPYPDLEIQSLFVRGVSGRYYESHDLGNSLLMLPAAWVAVTITTMLPSLNLKGVAGTYSDSSLIIAKTLCSLTATMFSAIACFFLFRLFRLFLGWRTSVALASLFPFGTYFAGYFRSCWDVVPACDSFCILLYFLTVMFAEERPENTTPMGAALWCAIICLFRYSMLPFLGIGMGLVFWRNRHRFHPIAYLCSAVVFLITLLPTLIFNLVRMGSLLKPATMSPQFSAQNGLSANIIPGAIGLLVSPNRGLFVFSPLLLLVIALPWCWRALPPPIRSILKSLTPGAFLYYVMISGLRNWGAAGWGPRYLLPFLPLIFLASAFVLTTLWNRARHWRAVSVLMIVVACCLSLPAILVNYTSAMNSDPTAIDTAARTPRQILDTLHALHLSLQGRSPERTELRAQEAAATFPDVAAARLFHALQGKSEGLALGFAATYLLAIAFVIYRLVGVNGNRREDASPILAI